MQVETISELKPKPARNRQQKNHRPPNREGHRTRGEERQPLPERHSEKHVAHQVLGEPVFDLVSLDVVVQLRNLAKGFSRKEPNFPSVWICDADEDNRNIRIAGGKNSDGLLIGGRSEERRVGKE